MLGLRRWIYHCRPSIATLCPGQKCISPASFGKALFQRWRRSDSNDGDCYTPVHDRTGYRSRASYVNCHWYPSPYSWYVTIYIFRGYDHAGKNATASNETSPGAGFVRPQLLPYTSRRLGRVVYWTRSITGLRYFSSFANSVPETPCRLGTGDSIYLLLRECCRHPGGNLLFCWIETSERRGRKELACYGKQS